MKKAIASFLKRFSDKAQAFRVAQQAAAARQLAEWRAGRRLKPSKSTKKAYEPGTIGVSKVSAEIIQRYGRPATRKERRQMARYGLSPVAFVPFYNK